MLAAFMNLRAGLYYELLSCFMGKGDKETFAAALAAVGAPYAVISTPLGSAGLRRTSCRHDCGVGDFAPMISDFHIPESSCRHCVHRPPPAMCFMFWWPTGLASRRCRLDAVVQRV